MSILTFTFQILIICGCWPPNSWTSRYKRIMYAVYTVCIVLLISTFMLSQLMDIILSVNNTDDFAENFYMTLTSIVCCYKMFSLLRNRSNIAMLIDILMKKPCLPIELDEIEIRQKFDRLIQKNTLYYATLVELTCAFALVTSFFRDYRKDKLPFRAWLPFNYSSPMLFEIAYVHQSISLTAGSVLQIACDSLICGLLMHICSQIEIFECHLRKIVNNSHFLRECIMQHTCISKFAFMVNKKFRSIITVQFVVSMLVVCFNLYQMTQMTINAKSIQIMLYMCCMLTQISIYCWYGNEVKLKSQQLIYNVFEMEWLTLDHNVQKSLLIIMTRSMIPIEFTSAYVISMNLESFVTLLKTSYSAYNILQQMQNCTFTLSQFLDLILIVDNPDDFTDNFYMLLAMIISCFKMSSLLVNRDNIAMLTDVLMKKPCIPIEPDEIEIRRKFDKLIEFAFMMNKKFRLTITFQFIVSTMVVCVTLYQLTKTNANIIQLGLYMSSMLTQIFLYCWYGNEVKLKSMQLTNNLFEIEWFMLREDVKKDLLTITRCGTVPIEFTSAYIFPMNLDSFVGLLKMSYSTYNILQQMRNENVEVIMRVLDFTFTILTLCGCWTPDSWISSYRRLLYYVYAIFIFLLINTSTLSQFLDLILIVDNPDDFTDNFYMLITMIVCCFKMSNLLVNRDSIAILTDILTKKPCKPVEPDEIEIRQKFDRLIEVNTLHYAILVELSSLYTVIQSLFTDYWKGKLLFRAWLPFDYTSTVLFHFMYFHQLIGLLVGALLHVACDSLICGLILHICCQIEILNSRMKRVIHNPKILRDYVAQHNLMIKFAFMVNEKFRLIITVQFIVSTLVVCVTLYQLTKTNAKVLELVLYMSCMLTQIFLYCWYGNEVKLKSMQLINNLFEIEWLALEKDVKKDLLIITRCGILPIEFTSAYIFPMNLDSFVGLLKTSYSTYNILQQMRDEAVEGK
ncbi:uncharacterized protein LOC105249981 [Camponotus floridanus]|uniref:uncharacterized protein LOC105249981 n=1 Tax=Camponotus floridanus TaxID=104421 RepID=UPI000DC6CEC6|nr:uncharacterized protein LOC105249981 [Camponotus floridanus]